MKTNRVATKQEAKKSEMTFLDYATSLSPKPPKNKSEKRHFVEGLAEFCDVTLQVVYKWISGEISPKPENQEKIAEFMGSSVAILFPVATTNEEN